MASPKEFSVQEKLATLVKLQKIDSKLDEIKVLKGELPIEVADLEDELLGLHSRKTKVEEEVNGINDYIEQKKELIRDSEELLKKYEQQSNNVKNSREFDAINKEMEMQTLEIKLAEKHIKDSNADLQEKAKKLDAANKAIAVKDGLLQNKKVELEKIIADTEIEEKQFQELADKARLNVDERLLASYSRIRNNYRNGLAVVPVLREACGGCFNSVPPQRQSEIKQHKKIVVCENCGRILVDQDIHDTTSVK